MAGREVMGEFREGMEGEERECELSLPLFVAMTNRLTDFFFFLGR